LVADLGKQDEFLGFDAFDNWLQRGQKSLRLGGDLEDIGLGGIYSGLANEGHHHPCIPCRGFKGFLGGKEGRAVQRRIVERDEEWLPPPPADVVALPRDAEGVAEN